MPLTTHFPNAGSGDDRGIEHSAMLPISSIVGRNGATSSQASLMEVV